uniref:Uncharacterized protein n=1 Tax=Hyaloperonospora arabidopsidis (strain Emoy2) TaxID=559515 RepID=M4C5M3_HYAAE
MALGRQFYSNIQFFCVCTSTSSCLPVSLRMYVHTHPLGHVAAQRSGLTIIWRASIWSGRIITSSNRSVRDSRIIL